MFEVMPSCWIFNHLYIISDYWWPNIWFWLILLKFLYRELRITCREMYQIVLKLYSAIRLDRTRGGRSNYEGSFTHLQSEKIGFHTSSPSSAGVAGTKRTVNGTPKSTKVPFSSLTPTCFNSNMPNLVARKPASIPKILEKLVSIESVMKEESDDSQCCLNKLTDADDDKFDSLLHLADHCLYKIVRWARSHPDFAHITVRTLQEYFDECQVIQILFFNTLIIVASIVQRISIVYFYFSTWISDCRLGPVTLVKCNPWSAIECKWG